MYRSMAHAASLHKTGSPSATHTKHRACSRQQAPAGLPSTAQKAPVLNFWPLAQGAALCAESSNERTQPNTALPGYSDGVRRVKSLLSWMIIQDSVA